MPKITINDIAKAAGVSRGTVDRVLNNRGRVHAEKQALILKIAEQIGFEKNTMASLLAYRTSKSIALVIPSTKSSYWQLVAKGAHESMAKIKHFNIEMEVFEFDISNASDYESALTNALITKPDVILLAPLFMKETIRFLQMARQNSIEIHSINTELQLDGLTSYTGQHSSKVGILAARLFLDKLDFNASTIAIISIGETRQNTQHTEDKIDAFKEYFKRYNSHVKFAEYELNLEDVQNKQITQPILDTNFLFFTNARIHSFMKYYFDLITEKHFVVGFDLLPNNIKYLRDGKITVLLNQRPAQQAEIAISKIANAWLNNTAVEPFTYLPTDIVLRENCDFYI